jgi:hypothetical protein
LVVDIGLQPARHEDILEKDEEVIDVVGELSD